MKLIRTGLSFRQLHGKRMHCNSDIVAIPISSYRLLYQTQENPPNSYIVLHHAAYDDFLKRLKHNHSVSRF